MNIFGVGLPEMALILVLALLVFGPKKLPEIGRSLAQALGSFKKAQQEFETEFKKEAEQLQKSIAEPMKASIERPERKALSPRKEQESEEQEETAAADSPQNGEGAIEVGEESSEGEESPDKEASKVGETAS